MSNQLPRISIVTPSYNQGQYLEETICSVLDQNYPNLEYIIMDGGSTDHSVEIIQRYAKHLTYWQSQKDRGQNHAITEGFKHATGDIFAYLNSDDKYLPWTLQTVANIFTQVPQVNWLTTRTTIVIDENGDPLTTNTTIEFTRRRFFSGLTLGDWHGESGWIQQEATFWTRALWEQAGARMDEALYMAGDFELWARFFQHANLVTTRVPLAMFRLHTTNKTQLDEYRRVAHNILKKYPHEKSYSPRKFEILNWVNRLGKQPRYGAANCWVTYNNARTMWVYRSEMLL